MSSNPISFQYIETDLRGIIAEATNKKTIPHIRDKSETVLTLVLGNGESSESDHVSKEIVSTLLLTSELTNAPKILFGTVSVLIKMCSQPGVVHALNYSHIVTVLCKTSYSLMSLIPSNTEGVPQEVELALLRCLQVVSLLAIDSLRDQFLDEVSLSQILALSANLITRKNTSPVVVQTAKGVLSHIELFLLDSAINSSIDLTQISNFSLPPGSTLTSTGEQMGVAHLCSSQSHSPLSALFAFVHDCVTMSDPESTLQIPCLLFGSSRVPRPLALEMLSDLVSRSPWHKHSPLITLGKLFLFPIVSRRIQFILSSDDPFDSLWFNLTSSIFKSSLIPFASSETEKLVIILNNFLSLNHRSDDRLIHVIKSLSSLVISGGQYFRSAPSCNPSPNSPLGGDSPVNKSRNKSTLIESVIDNVALYISQSFANFGDSKTDQKILLSKGFPPIDLITAYVSALYRDEHAADLVESTWAPIMSVFQLVVPLESSIDSFSTFIFLLPRHHIRRGLSSAVALLVEYPDDDFVLTTTTCMIEDDSYSMDNCDWSILIRSLSTRKRGSKIFTAIRHRSRAEIVLQSLIPINSKWTIECVSELLLQSPGGLDNIVHLWANFVGPYFLNTNLVPDLVPDVISLTLRVAESVISADNEESVILSTLINLSEKFPDQLSNPLCDFVQNFGHKITDWKSVIACVSQIDNLRINEIIIDDFLDKNTLFISQLIANLEKMISKESTNNAFLIISLVQRCWRPDEFSAIAKFFAIACLDARMDVRNCAIKTLTNLPIHNFSLLIDITVSVYNHSRSCSPTDRSRDEEESAGLIVHHTQDTEEKRWNESVSCCLRMLSHASRNFDPTPIIESEDIANILTYIFANPEMVPNSAIELLVTLVRKSSPVSAPYLLVKIIEQQAVEVNSKTTRLMLPDLLSGCVPQPMIQCVYSLFSTFISHPSVRINKPIPPIIVADDDHGECLVDFPQLRIDSTVSSMISNTKTFFNQPTFLDLILGKDSFFVDSGSIHLGLRTIDHLVEATDLEPSVRESLISRLERFALEIDSRGIWKYAIQKLIQLNATDSLVRVFDSLSIGELVSPIQYRLFVSLVEKIQTTDRVFCDSIVCQLSTCDGTDFSFGSKQHYLIFMFLTVLSSIVRDGNPPPFPTTPSFSLNEVVTRRYTLPVTESLSEKVLSLAYTFLTNETSDLITVPILSLLENDIGFKFFLEILPGTQLVMSQNDQVRKSFTRVLEHYTPRIRRMC